MFVSFVGREHRSLRGEPPTSDRTYPVPRSIPPFGVRCPLPCSTQHDDPSPLSLVARPCCSRRSHLTASPAHRPQARDPRRKGSCRLLRTRRRCCSPCSSAAAWSGVSSLCDFPDEVRTLPKVGALGSLSLEAILALRPDAVVGAPGAAASLIDRLQAPGIRVSLTAVESVDSVRSLARALSDLCHAPDALQRWSTAFERELQQAQSVFAPPNGRAPRVLAVIDQRPLVCAGPGSYMERASAAFARAKRAQLGPRVAAALDGIRAAKRPTWSSTCAVPSRKSRSAARGRATRRSPRCATTA